MNTVIIEKGPGGTEIIATRVVARVDGKRHHKPTSHRTPPRNALQLRQAFESASRDLAAAGNGDMERLQKQLALVQRQREQFWIDTCREPRQARAASRQVADLHRQHGWRFVTPSLSQVQAVLEALDSALPAWDDDRPALFFQTLELNFPGVVRVLPQPWKR